jgi:hypothetical protein
MVISMAVRLRETHHYCCGSRHAIEAEAELGTEDGDQLWLCTLYHRKTMTIGMR